MPAANIIEIHDQVLKAGFSPSLPSGMLPKRLAASQRTKTTKIEAVSTNAQPVAFITQPRAVVDAVDRLSVPTKPQTTNAMVRTATTPKMTLSTPLPMASSFRLSGRWSRRRRSSARSPSFSFRLTDSSEYSSSSTGSAGGRRW